MDTSSASSTAAIGAVPAIALRVSDLFNARATESTYQRLVDFLNEQALETQRLRVELRQIDAAHRATSAHTATKVDGAIAAVLTRLTHIETHVRSQLERNERVDARMEQLESAEREAVLEWKANRDEVMRVESATTKALFQIRSEAASFELVNSLQVDQQLLHDRLSTVDRRLDAKMEKSESSRMDALVAKISAFAPTSERLAQQLAGLAAQHMHMRALLDAASKRSATHKQTLKQLERRVGAVETRAGSVERAICDRVAPQLAAQSEQLLQLDNVFARLATQASTIDAAQRSLAAKSQSTAAALAMQLEQQRETFERLIHERASSADTTERLDDLDRALQSCALATDVHALATEFERLAAQSNALRKHVQLSARFVDWFAARGEAYEHNLDVVEAQLQRVAEHSQPARREPFGQQVRYPHR